jgi:hypothetical protein
MLNDEMNMTIEQQALYDQMLSEIAVVNPTGDYPSSCFWIALQYWERLKKTIRVDLLNEAETIEFFKHTKPAFTCQVQYYTMISEALLCVPQDQEEELLFWKSELLRLTRFESRNKEIVKYYDSGDCSRDEEYFSFVPEDWTAPDLLAYYDSDINFCSPFDHRIRGLLAQRMYRDFALKFLQFEETKNIE